jgi:hypothetical protein
MKWRMLAGLAVILLWTSAAAAEEAKIYPGASPDAETAKQLQLYQAQMKQKYNLGVSTPQFYSTTDHFAKVYDFYKKLYPETDLALRRHGYPLTKDLRLSKAYFCLDNAKSVFHSKHWIKLQSPSYTTQTKGAKVEYGNIRNVTLIAIVQK